VRRQDLEHGRFTIVLSLSQDGDHVSDGESLISLIVKVIADAEGTYEDPSSEFCTLVGDAFENIYKVKNTFFFAPGSSDATYMRNGGMKNVVMIGPNGQNTHTSDEYVLIDDLIQCTKVYLLTAYRFLK